MFVVLVTSFVVSVEGGTVDSIVPVGVTVVTGVDCGSMVEDIIVVDGPWLVIGRTLVSGFVSVLDFWPGDV